MTSPDSDRTVHWYYRTEGKDQGPVLVSRLRQMAHQGALAASDLVRKGKTGEWVPAATYPEIEAQVNQPIAAPELVKADSLQEIPEAPRPNRLSEFADSIRERVSEFAYDSYWAIASRTTLIRTITGYFALAVVGVCLVWFASGIGQSERRSPADPYQTCQSLWEELRQLREKTADDASWGDFTVRGRDQLAPIVAQLEGEASSKNRIGQLLLWASRDCLPKMFVDARTEPSSSETLLAEYLENVDRLQKGERVYRTSPAGPKFQAKSSLDWFKTEPLTAGLTVFFMVLNGGLLSWFVWSLVRKRLIEG